MAYKPRESEQLGWLISHWLISRGLISQGGQRAATKSEKISPMSEKQHTWQHGKTNNLSHQKRNHGQTTLTTIIITPRHSHQHAHVTTQM